MGKTVLLSIADGEWNVWGERFVKRQPLQREQQTMPAGATAAVAKQAIIKAAQTAGGGGMLIISVGHGGTVAGSTSEGKFELAPHGAMTIAGGLVEGRFVDVFYDVPKAPGRKSDLETDISLDINPEKRANWKVYQDLAGAIRTAGLNRIVLLTCKVGNSTEFLRKVANDWGVVIQAYKRQVGIQQFVGTGSLAGTKPIRTVFLVGFATTPTSPADQIQIQEEEIPFNPDETFNVGPPLKGS